MAGGNKQIWYIDAGGIAAGVHTAYDGVAPLPDRLIDQLGAVPVLCQNIGFYRNIEKILNLRSPHDHVV